MKSLLHLISKDNVVRSRVMREFNKFTCHMLRMSKKKIMDEGLRCGTWEDIDELIAFWIGKKAA